MSRQAARLPAVITSHDRETILSALDESAGFRRVSVEGQRVLADVAAEALHLRDQLRRAQDLATRERDQRMESERAWGRAVAELDLIRRAWVATSPHVAPPAAISPYPDATG